MTRFSMMITACCLATATAAQAYNGCDGTLRITQDASGEVVARECIDSDECPEGTHGFQQNPDILYCRPCPECAPSGQYYLGSGVKTAIKENRCVGNWLVIETDENVDLVQSQCMRTPVCPGGTEETATHANTTYFTGKGNWLVCQPKPTH